MLRLASLTPWVLVTHQTQKFTFQPLHHAQLPQALPRQLPAGNSHIPTPLSLPPLKSISSFSQMFGHVPASEPRAAERYKLLGQGVELLCCTNPNLPALPEPRSGSLGTRQSPQTRLSCARAHTVPTVMNDLQLITINCPGVPGQEKPLRALSVLPPRPQVCPGQTQGEPT